MKMNNNLRRVMDIKKIIQEKGLTQIRICKILNLHPAIVSMQVNKYRMLPKKYRDDFCKLLGISPKDLEKAMEEDINE
jgi:predicted transcriptional regulator